MIAVFFSCETSCHITVIHSVFVPFFLSSCVVSFQIENYFSRGHYVFDSKFLARLISEVIDI